MMINDDDLMMRFQFNYGGSEQEVLPAIWSNVLFRLAIFMYIDQITTSAFGYVAGFASKNFKKLRAYRKPGSIAWPLRKFQKYPEGCDVSRAHTPLLKLICH